MKTKRRVYDCTYWIKPAGKQLKALQEQVRIPADSMVDAVQQLPSGITQLAVVIK